MKHIWKIIVILIILAIIVGVIVAWPIVDEGYKMYKKAVDEVSIETKVDEIRNKKGYTKLEDMPNDYKNAVLAVEDHRFYYHFGIDLISLGRAIINNIKAGELVEGGSTITQQLVKNMYFTQEKKFSRKVAELFVTFKLESKYTKDEILEMYINVIYFGEGYYGINAASHGYLDKAPKDMTLYESTLLAGLPNAPSAYALGNNPELARQRQNQVLDKMLRYRYLTQQQVDAVRKEMKNNKITSYNSEYAMHELKLAI